MRLIVILLFNPHNLQNNTVKKRKKMLNFLKNFKFQRKSRRSLSKAIFQKVKSIYGTLLPFKGNKVPPR